MIIRNNVYMSVTRVQIQDEASRKCPQERSESIGSPFSYG